jgi:RsiW-degrading membrane proteinase PrsW (M82 family)
MNFDPHLLVTIFFAFISGIIPALIWLFFWTNEDKKNPEPKSMIALAFIGGMVAVFISLFLEKYLFGLGLTKLFYADFLQGILSWFEIISKTNSVPLDKVLLVVVFAPIIEELTKFIMAYILVLRAKCDDEPLDPMVYLITTALGFAAIENMLFLINPVENHDIVLSIFTGNMRFIGATLLHVISSATIALFISFNFFGSRLRKMIFTFIGIACSVLMHGMFNFFMIGSQEASIMALELIWIAVIIILLAFEKIKKIRLEKID